VLFAALALAVAYLSIYPALFGLGYAVGRRVAPPVVVTPVMWIAAEYLRSQGELGFPWASLAYSLYAQPSLIQGASFAGMWGVGLWIALVNACALSGLMCRGLRGRAVWGAAALALVACGYIQGSLSMKNAEPAAEVRAALIQPNVATQIKWDPAYKDEIMNKILDMTRDVEGPLDLVVWPETAVPSVLLLDAPYLDAVKSLAAEIGVPIVTGFPHFERSEGGGRHAYNSASLINPDGGVAQRYDKLHLVPFSERFPFQNVVPFLSAIDFGQSDFTAGESHVVYDIPDGKFGVLICFESLFPEISREFVRCGADFLLNITNDAWFGKSQAPLQHASMAVFRAVEHRIGIGRAANTGITMFIDRYGRMLQSTELFVERTVTGSIERRSGTTFYTRHGDYAGWGALLAAAALLLPAGFRALSGRRRP
jgi:apolipoprotein N-acyltransferase